MSDLELRFPTAFSLGKIFIRPMNDGHREAGRGSEGDVWHFLAPARGTVILPTAQSVSIKVEPWGHPPWSRTPLVSMPTMENVLMGLQQIDSTVVEELNLSNLSELPVSDTEISIISRFSALRSLNLGNRELPVDGFRQLSKSLSHLWKLSTRWAPGLNYFHGLRMLEVSGYDIQDADVACLSDFKNLEYLLLQGPNLTGGCLNHLSRLDSLEELHLPDIPISDEDAQYLTLFHNLKTINLEGQLITNAALPYLFPINQLECLGLTYTQISDKGLIELCRHCLELRELTLSGSPVTSDGLSEIHNLRHLVRLNLYRTRVTDAGVRHLTSLSGLRELNLGETAVLGEDSSMWSGLSGLQELHLFKTQVGDASGWSGLSGLRNLYLSETQVSDVALDSIGKRLSFLEMLDLSDTHVVGTGISSLNPLLHLKHLHLSSTPLPTPALESLGQLCSLEDLSFNGTGILGDELAPLVGLTNLKSIGISGLLEADKGLQVISLWHELRLLSLSITDLTDVGLKTITGFDQLEVLSLRFNKISDAGLAVLKNMPRLKEVDLTGNPITKSGLNNLYLALSEDTTIIC